MFEYMQELMFYNECPGPHVILLNFATGLGAAMMKTLNQNEVPGGETQFACDMTQSTGFGNYRPLIGLGHSFLPHYSGCS